MGAGGRAEGGEHRLAVPRRAWEASTAGGGRCRPPAHRDNRLPAQLRAAPVWQLDQARRHPRQAPRRHLQQGGGRQLELHAAAGGVVRLQRRGAQRHHQHARHCWQTLSSPWPHEHMALGGDRRRQRTELAWPRRWRRWRRRRRWRQWPSQRIGGDRTRVTQSSQTNVRTTRCGRARSSGGTTLAARSLTVGPRSPAREYTVIASSRKSSRSEGLLPKMRWSTGAARSLRLVAGRKLPTGLQFYQSTVSKLSGGCCDSVTK